MAAFQMVHIMEGVIQRGTATCLRDLNRPMFGKTGTTSGPTNVWFVGGTPDIVAGVYLGYDQPRSMGGYAQGGAIRADLQAMGADRAQGSAESAVRRAGRHSLGPRSTARPESRSSACSHDRRPEVVGDLGSFPAPDRAAAQLPKSIGDPYNRRSGSRRSRPGRQQQLQLMQEQRHRGARNDAAVQQPRAVPPQPTAGLPTQNSL
jgi:penicillin-binding protein 1A